MKLQMLLEQWLIWKGERERERSENRYSQQVKEIYQSALRHSLPISGGGGVDTMIF